jgi:hypothetical protein
MTPRPKLRNRLERRSPFVRTQQGTKPIGRSGRPARLLDLEARAADRKLQLPDAAPALGASAQRDARAGERAADRVVVDRCEDARLERLPAEVGELESLWRFELALVLECRLHGGDNSRAQLPTEVVTGPLPGVTQRRGARRPRRSA